MRKVKIFYVLWAVSFFVGNVFSADPPISIEEIGEILKYPPDKIKVVDETEKNQKKLGDVVRSVHLFKGVEKGTFATVSIVVGDRRAILSEKQEAGFIKFIEEEPNPDDPEPVAKKIDFEGSAYGFGYGLLGAGGSVERVIATYPDNNTDIQVAISFGEEPLDPSNGLEDYIEHITNTKEIVKTLSGMVRIVAAKELAQAGATKEPNNSVAKNDADSGEKPSRQNKTNQEDPSSEGGGIVSSDNKKEELSEDSSKAWIWFSVIGILVLIVASRLLQKVK